MGITQSYCFKSSEQMDYIHLLTTFILKKEKYNFGNK